MEYVKFQLLTYKQLIYVYVYVFTSLKSLEYFSF